MKWLEDTSLYIRLHAVNLTSAPGPGLWYLWWSLEIFRDLLRFDCTWTWTGPGPELDQSLTIIRSPLTNWRTTLAQFSHKSQRSCEIGNYKIEREHFYLVTYWCLIIYLLLFIIIKYKCQITKPIMVGIILSGKCYGNGAWKWMVFTLCV